MHHMHAGAWRSLLSMGDGNWAWFLWSSSLLNCWAFSPGTSTTQHTHAFNTEAVLWLLYSCSDINLFQLTILVFEVIQENHFWFFYWLFGNDTSCTLIVLTSQSFHVRPLPCDLFLQGEKVHFVLAIYSLEHGQTPIGRPPQRGWVFFCARSYQLRRNCGSQLTLPELWAGEGWGQLSCTHGR